MSRPSSLATVLAFALCASACSGCEANRAAAPAIPEPAPAPAIPAVAAAPATAPARLVVTAGADLPFKVFALQQDPEGKLTERPATEGTCNTHQPSLAPGRYRVEVVPEGGAPVSLGEIALKAGETRTLQVKGFGTLRVRAVQDFLEYTLHDADGGKVADGDTNITAHTVAAGRYTARIAPLPGAQRTLGPIEVAAGAAAELRLEGFGTLLVEASKDFIGYRVLDAAGRELGKGDTRITTLLLPVGEYSLAFEEKTVPGVVIEEGKALRFPSGL